MVDAAVVAAKVAAIRDAVARIRETLPSDARAFEADRTAREVAILNLFVAHQYGALDPRRVHEMASSELGDLLEFCQVVSRAATRS